MGIITKIALLRSVGRPVFRIFRATKELAHAHGVEIPLMDQIEDAIEEAQEYAEAFGGTGEQKREKAAEKVEAAFDQIDKRRGWKVKDRDVNRQHMRHLVGLFYDIAQNREADDNKLAPED